MYLYVYLYLSSYSLLVFIEYFRHTFRLTFDVGWIGVNKVDKNHLALLINNCIMYMNKKNCKLVKVFNYLKEISKTPWSNDYWHNILHGKQVDEASGKFCTLKTNFCVLYFLFINKIIYFKVVQIFLTTKSI